MNTKESINKPREDPRETLRERADRWIAQGMTLERARELLTGFAEERLSSSHFAKAFGDWPAEAIEVVLAALTAAEARETPPQTAFAEGYTAGFLAGKNGQPPDVINGFASYVTAEQRADAAEQERDSLDGLRRASNAHVMRGLKRIATALEDDEPTNLGSVDILASLVEHVVQRRREAEALLRRLAINWDGNDQSGFFAALTEARTVLGLKLTADPAPDARGRREAQT